MHTVNKFGEKLLALRKKLGITQSAMADRMGLSMSYVHQLEVGKRTPSDSVETIVRMLEAQFAAGMIEDPSSTMLREESTAYRRSSKFQNRMIPVVGCAHAGEAQSYEEIPNDWQDWVQTDCRDEKAFAVRVEGDSMNGSYLSGDVLILTPSNEIYNGCLAVIKMKSDGFIFRQIERRGEILKLIPLNPRWEMEELLLSDVEWAFPLYAMFRQVWKK